MSATTSYPEAVWCMHCGAGSRMSFIPDPLNFHCPFCNQWNHLDQELYMKKPFNSQTKKRISTGISQIGGKYRLLRQILERIPIHEFYLEPFLGSGIVLANKPRCRYECGNDRDSEFINYLLVVKYYPKEFDKLKKGVFGLVSQDICNRIVRGELKPRNNIERAYFFYYLNKLCFGGKQEIENTNYCGTWNNRALPTIRKEYIDEIKSNYRGITLPTVCKDKSIEEAKANFRGISSKVKVETLLKQSKASYKGINPKTTRPFSNNDCGLLTPLDPNVIKRLRYINLTCYDFRKLYKMFYDAFYIRKGLTKECFLYFDPPYPNSEKYYKSGFGDQEHFDLITILLDSPFNCMLSIGGMCEIYVDILKEAGWIIYETKVKYSTDARTQSDSREYIIMNYDLNKIPKMIMDIQPSLEAYI